MPPHLPATTRTSITTMALKTIITALAAANVVFGHFGLTSPQWRADTLSEENESKYSQWTYPCKKQDARRTMATNQDIVS